MFSRLHGLFGMFNLSVHLVVYGQRYVLNTIALYIGALVGGIVFVMLVKLAVFFNLVLEFADIDVFMLTREFFNKTCSMPYNVFVIHVHFWYFGIKVVGVR